MEESSTVEPFSSYSHLEVWNRVHSLSANSRFRLWRRSDPTKCTVKIYHPKLKIKGLVIENNSITKYVAFLGVPYARPPVGSLRFEPPKPLPPFIGPRSILKLGARETVKLRAYKEPNRALQVRRNRLPRDIHYRIRNLIEDRIEGSEDCLYMNIYTPQKPEFIPNLLPVLVYFHGGAFEHGSGNPTDGILPDYVTREGLVLIAVNYRLGPFGFLNMRSENCRGNAGLKDQVMALRWIRDNVVQFKGNPENVTIAGQSAGGSCVNFHMISPLSKGLFHKAIVMGGGVYCPWGYTGHAREVMQLFKQKTGKTGMVNVTRTVVVEVLKRKTVNHLLLDIYKNVSRAKFMLQPERAMVYLGPTTERDPENAFLPDTIDNLMRRATPVPTIAGITKQEGYMHFRANPRGQVALVKNTPKFYEFVKQNFRWDAASVERHIMSLRRLYFPDLHRMTDDEIKEHLATMVTDIYFRRFYDNFRIGQLMESESPPLYVYEFDYFTGRPIDPFPKRDGIEPRSPVIRAIASEHGDDLVFLLCPKRLSKFVKGIRNPDERHSVGRNMVKVVNHMASLCASFCRGDVPESIEQENFRWIPHTETDPQYLHIDVSLTMRNGRLNEDRWSNINRICAQEQEVQSLPTTPQTPES